MLNIYFIIFSDVLERSVCPQSPVPSAQCPMFQCPIVMVHHPPTADQDSSSINWLWYLVVWKSGDRKDIEIERRVAGRERKLTKDLQLFWSLTWFSSFKKYGAYTSIFYSRALGSCPVQAMYPYLTVTNYLLRKAFRSKS